MTKILGEFRPLPALSPRGICEILSFRLWAVHEIEISPIGIWEHHPHGELYFFFQLQALYEAGLL